MSHSPTGATPPNSLGGGNKKDPQADARVRAAIIEKCPIQMESCVDLVEGVNGMELKDAVTALLDKHAELVASYVKSMEKHLRE